MISSTTLTFTLRILGAGAAVEFAELICSFTVLKPARQGSFRLGDCAKKLRRSQVN
jgi:hypothetical protein